MADAPAASTGQVMTLHRAATLAQENAGTVERAALAKALAKARDEGKKTEGAKAEAAMKAVRTAHAAEMERARDVELVERAALMAKAAEKEHHRVQGARTFGILAGVVGTLAVAVPVTWIIASAILMNGVDVGMEAMGRSRIIEDTLTRPSDAPAFGDPARDLDSGRPQSPREPARAP